MRSGSAILLILAALFLAPAHAQTALDEFERGNAFYREGQFQRAIESYEAIVRQGLVSSALYFNLGNAYYRLGKIAPSILAYERALLLNPNDPDTKHNLELANLRTVDRIEPLPKLFFVEWLLAVSAYSPLSTTAWLFTFCWILLFSALTILFAFPQPMFLRALRLAVAIPLILLIPLGILLTTQVLEGRSRNDAIILVSSATARTSPDAQSVDAFVIHEGLKVALGDSVAGWVKITLADGKVGWIRAEECERI